jgi:hypothetical protein
MVMTFDDYYYDVYLPKHRKPMTKLCHMLGVAATLAWIVYFFFVGPLWLLLLSPFVVYPFAWGSHLIFEGNKPAAFKNPVWAKMADLRMCKDLLMGDLSWSH